MRCKNADEKQRAAWSPVPLMFAPGPCSMRTGTDVVPMGSASRSWGSRHSIQPCRAAKDRAGIAPMRSAIRSRLTFGRPRSNTLRLSDLPFDPPARTMTPFAIAGIQMPVSAETENLTAMGKRLNLLMYRFAWVQMVLFSEACASGPSPKPRQRIGGPAAAAYCEIAARQKIWMIPGSMFERREEGT